MSFSPIPAKTPFLGEGGRVAWPWLKWFDSAFQQIGDTAALVAMSAPQADTTGAFVAQLNDLQTQIQLIPNLPANLERAVQELQTQVAMLASPDLGGVFAAIVDLQGQLNASAPTGGYIPMGQWEVPAGTLDGINAVFTIVNVPNPVLSLLLFLNGVRLQPATDYTLAGQTITFATAPLTTDFLFAHYFV